MAKRAKRLWGAILDRDNVVEAYVKARRGKRDRADVVAFERDFDEEINWIQRQLASGRLEVGNYHFFKIYDPKERLICAAPFRERVLHHALMNVCEPTFERFLIDQSYACRKGKGRLAAIDYAKRHVRRYRWYAKMDIRHYFEIVPHRELEFRLRGRFGDERVLAGFSQIIRSYETGTGCGLPIGNLTSQHFANFYLGYLDRFAKEELKVRGYARYMDDMVIWGDTREEVREISRRMEAFAEGELKLEMKPVVINRTEHGMDFLGFRLFPGRTRLTARNKKRFIRRTRELCSEDGYREFGERGLQDRLTAQCAFVSEADTWGLRKRVYGPANAWLESL